MVWLGKVFGVKIHIKTCAISNQFYPTGSLTAKMCKPIELTNDQIISVRTKK